MAQVEELDDKGRQAGLQEGDWVIFGKPQVGTRGWLVMFPSQTLYPLGWWYAAGGALLGRTHAMRRGRRGGADR